jgi:hypothetical protein
VKLQQRARRIAAPSVYALERVRRLHGRGLIVFGGIALGGALVASVLAVGLAVEDRSFVDTLATQPPVVRAFATVDANRAAGLRTAADRTAREALAPFGRPPTSIVQVVADGPGSSFIPVVFTDDVGALVRIADGRRPRPCARECEVVQVGYPDPVPPQHGTSFPIVGRAIERGQPFGQADGYSFPYYVAAGIRSVALDPHAFPGRERTFIWQIAPKRGSLHSWDVDRYATTVRRANSTLASRLSAQTLSGTVGVEGGVEGVREAERSVRTAQSRLLLIAGQGAAVLVAFVVLCGTRMRHDVDLACGRLRTFGARRWQVNLAVLVESLLLAAAATVLGWLVGALVSLALAARLGAAASGVVWHALTATSAIAVAAALALAAGAVLFATLRLAPVRLGSRRVTALDALALAAAAVAVFGLVRGAPDARNLADDRGLALLLAALPTLVAVVAAGVAARLTVPLYRALGRWAGRAPLALKLAALSVSRRSGSATTAAAFVVVSVSISVFAVNYRSTLMTAQREQVDFDTPYSIVIRENTDRLVAPATLGPPSIFSGRYVTGVLRLAASVSRLDSELQVTALGIDPAGVPRVSGWRDDFSSLSLHEIGRRITPPFDTGFRGVPLPPRHRVIFPLRARGAPLELSMVVETRSGAFETVAVGTTHDRELAATLPARLRGGRVVSFVFGMADVGLHQAPRAGEYEHNAVGVLELGPVAWLPFSSLVGEGGIELTAHGHSALIRYAITTSETARLRVAQPTDRQVLPVIVSPRLGAAVGEHNLLPLSVTGTPIVARVVGVATHFPSIHGDFVLADRRALTTAMNARVPATPAYNEVWIDDPQPARIRADLRFAPFDALDVQYRPGAERAVRRSPVGRGAIVLLAITAAVAAALAAAGVALVASTDARDDARELFDLEAAGADRTMLRRHLRLRAGLVAAWGACCGVGVGIALSALAAALVAVTATATVPDPPLRLVVAWPQLAADLAAATVVTGAAVLWLTRRRSE